MNHIFTRNHQPFADISFTTLNVNNRETICTAGNETITLALLKSLTVSEFSLPFTQPARITSALRLASQAFTSAGSAEMFTAITSRKGRSANGIAWYISPNELPDDPIVWPAPLPLVSGLSSDGGNGITCWHDGNCSASLLWQSYVPVLYRWSRSDPAELIKWYDNYCTRRSLERGGTFVIDTASLPPHEEFAGIVSSSVSLCPWIRNVNISRASLDAGRTTDNFVRAGTKASMWALLLGALTLGSCLMSLAGTQSLSSAYRSRSEEYYRSAFDPSHRGRVANPVALARDMIAASSGTTGVAHPLSDVMSDLGEIFSASPDITLDTLRYNSEGIDITGTAPDQSAVLNFRRAWEDRGAAAQVDNTQFVSGIGYRFDLRVRWR